MTGAAALAAAAVAGTVLVVRALTAGDRPWRTRDAAADAIRRGEPQTAISLLEGRLAEAENDSTAWALLAEARLAASMPAPALQAAERAVRLAPGSAAARVSLARCRLLNGDVRGACVALEDVAGAEAALLRWQALLATGRTVAALESLAAAADAGVVDAGILLDGAATAAVALETGGGRSGRIRGHLHSLVARVRDAARTAPPGTPAEADPLFVAALEALAAGRAEATELLDRVQREEHGTTRARRVWIAHALRTRRVSAARAAAARRPGAEMTLLAVALGQAGDSEGEIELLRSRHRDEPSDDECRAALAAALVRCGRRDEAAVLVRAVEPGPSVPVSLLAVAAEAAASSGDSARARRLLDAASARVPGDASLRLRRNSDALVSLLRSVAARRDPAPEEEAAERLVAEVLAADPSHPDALGWAARLQQARGLHAEALATARRRAESAPESEDARSHLHALICASARVEDLDELAGRLISDPAASPADLRALASAALASGRADSALLLTTAAAARQPGDPALTLLHARALVAAGRPESAGEHLTAVFGESPDDARALELLTWTRALTGRPGPAPGAPASGEPADLAAARARALLAAGRADEAEARVRDALARNPGAPRLRAALGEILAARGRLAEAADLLADSLGSPPDAAVARVLGDTLLRASRDLPRRAERIERLRDSLRSGPSPAGELLRLDARIALDSGRPADAAELFTRHVTAFPDDADAWFDLSAARELAGDSPGALDAARAAVRVAPGHPRAARARVRLEFEAAARSCGAGDVAAARTALEAIVASDPAWVPARLAASVLLLEQGLPDLSADHCRKILGADPGDVVAALVLAFTRHAAGDSAGALADLDALVLRRPDLSAVRVKRGIVRLSSGRVREAEEDFSAARDAGASGSDLDTGLAACALHAGRTDEAVTLARRAVGAAPRAADARRVLAAALQAVGDIDGSVTAWLAAAAVEPRDSRPLLLAADLLRQRGRWRDVLDVTGRLGPPSGALLEMRARAEWQLGMRSEARASAEAAADSHAPAWATAGAMADEGGDFATAARCYESALRAGAADATLKARLAALWIGAGRASEAAEILEPLVAAHPGSAGLVNNLALALVADLDIVSSAPAGPDDAPTRARADRALLLAGRARDMAPESAAVADTLGRIRLLTGDLDGARQALERARELGPCASAAWHLGLVARRRGDGDGAAKWFRTALAEEPRAAWAAAARALLGEPDDR